MATTPTETEQTTATHPLAIAATYVGTYVDEHGISYESQNSQLFLLPGGWGLIQNRNGSPADDGDGNRYTGEIETDYELMEPRQAERHVAWFTSGRPVVQCRLCANPVPAYDVEYGACPAARRARNNGWRTAPISPSRRYRSASKSGMPGPRKKHPA